MMKILGFLFFAYIAAALALSNDAKKGDGVHIITKNIDISQLKGTFYEIASNASAKVVPGLACRCTKYVISELHKDDTAPYLYVDFSCQRNFLFHEEKSQLLFKFVLKHPPAENTTVVEEFTTHVYIVKDKKDILVDNCISLLYAEADESNNYKYLIFGGTSPLQPMFILSRERNISKEDYNRLLTSLYLSGYNMKLLNWPFIMPCDQNLCED